MIRVSCAIGLSHTNHTKQCNNAARDYFDSFMLRVLLVQTFLRWISRQERLHRALTEPCQFQSLGLPLRGANGKMHLTPVV